ncbi:pyridine nucleotide-disulfide oxidoreductase domain-containing protein 2-like isoform X2 [Pteropus vampyrus]|uniref:Pyridine nucleotide-disulfide oxidoreductase domain-containing protein 2-like isoform X2 n=1 Tax=Pteropus vampyrus TaxID=132908 RepID=A0A6P6C5B3_PTEVA|nr:pyridine nucleotide-disulfide oxidoreductase domain-containing protein 2-like isoform X2 [Pteropus vampyrus]
MEWISGRRGQGTSLSKGRKQPRGGLGHPRGFHGNFSFQKWLPKEFTERISQLDTRSPVTKINAPSAPEGQPLPQHHCSIHLNCEDIDLLHQAFEDAVDGRPSHRWVRPSALCPLEYSYTWSWGEGGDCPDTAGIASSSWLNIHDDVDICLNPCLGSKVKKCIPHKKSLGQGRLRGEE